MIIFFFFKKCLLAFSQNNKSNEIFQHAIYFFKHLLKLIVKFWKIQSQLVGQILFLDMSLGLDTVVTSQTVELDERVQFRRQYICLK